MYAVFVEVNATEANSEAAREFLPRVAVLRRPRFVSLPQSGPAGENALQLRFAGGNARRNVADGAPRRRVGNSQERIHIS